MTSAFIFDFDGTLVDSEQAIYQCFQSITEKLAPSRVEYAKNILIGPPLRDTSSEILGPYHQDLLDEFMQLFITMHDEQVIQHTKPYPDVIQVLKKLHTENIPMSLATNKRIAPTQKLIDHYGWGKFFKHIECSDSFKITKNKNQMVKKILNESPEFINGFLVGDTVNDGYSANLNKLKFIKAIYGYGKKQDWTNVSIFRTIYKLNEIFQLIK